MTRVPAATRHRRFATPRTDDRRDARRRSNRSEGAAHRRSAGGSGFGRAHHQAAHSRHRRSERKEHVRDRDLERAGHLSPVRAGGQRLPHELPGRHDRAHRPAYGYFGFVAAEGSGTTHLTGRISNQADRRLAREGRDWRHDVLVPIRGAAADPDESKQAEKAPEKAAAPVAQAAPGPKAPAGHLNEKQAAALHNDLDQLEMQTLGALGSTSPATAGVLKGSEVATSALDQAAASSAGVGVGTGDLKLGSGGGAIRPGMGGTLAGIGSSGRTTGTEGTGTGAKVA